MNKNKKRTRSTITCRKTHKMKAIILSSLLLLSPQSNAFEFDINKGIDGFSSFLEGINLNLDAIIPGLGSISIRCQLPALKFKNFSVCGLQNALLEPLFFTAEKYYNSIPFLGESVCGFSVQLNDTQCRNIVSKKYCASADKLIADAANIDKLKSGIGGFEILANKKLSLYAGKEMFGEDLCFGSDKRTEMIDTPELQKVYGSDETSWSSKLLNDKEIGGSPVFLNTRKGQRFLKCMESSKGNKMFEESCYLKSENAVATYTSSDIQKNIKESAAMLSTPPIPSEPGKMSQNATNYWSLFVKYSKKEGIKDPKILLAIAMQESGRQLNINAVGDNGTSVDWGMMQLNDKWQKDRVLGAYPTFATVEQALMPRSSGMGAVERSIAMGAQVLSECYNNKRVPDPTQTNWTSVDCYNKGAGGAGRHKLTAQYINGVKSHYASIGGADMSLFDDALYETQTNISQGVANYATVSSSATSRMRTITHSGQDIVDRLPKELRKEYSQMINRYMAQRTFIEASHKKAAEISKAIADTFQFQSSIRADSTLQ